jgi:hypothetical protein
MDSTYWLRYFQDNRCDRPEPPWHLPYHLDPAVAAKLARSLSHFQLGESGEGTFLLAEARRRYPGDHHYVEGLRLFIAEEQEHARLLERLVARFGGDLTTRHWTHGCFSWLRRALGVDFEIQVLAVAEIIGTVYYRLLRAGTNDAVLAQVCDLMLSDEAAHLEFHSQRVAERQSGRLPLGRTLWVAQFRGLFLAATLAAWLDHRPALRALGDTRRRFFLEARDEFAAFAGALTRPRTAAAR